MLNKRMIFGPMTAEQREFMSHTQEELEVKHKRTSEIGALWFLGFFALISAVVNHLFLGVLYESAVMQILVTVAAVIISTRLRRSAIITGKSVKTRTICSSCLAKIMQAKRTSPIRASLPGTG